MTRSPLARTHCRSRRTYCRLPARTGASGLSVKVRHKDRRQLHNSISSWQHPRSSDGTRCRCLSDKAARLRRCYPTYSRQQEITKMLQASDVATINPARTWTNPLRLPLHLAARRKGELLGEFNVPAASRQVAEWEHGCGQVLILAGDKPCEMEFLLPFHLALMLPDGSSPGWEWSNGERFQVIRSLGAGAILFSPAHEYLRVRKLGRGRCRVVLIAINPGSINRIDGIDVDVPQVKFRQEINFYDESVYRTLATI